MLLAAGNDGLLGDCQGTGRSESDTRPPSQYTTFVTSQTDPDY